MNYPAHLHSAYGFTIRSAFPLPAVRVVAAATDAPQIEVIDCGRAETPPWHADFAISEILDVAVIAPTRWIARCHHPGYLTEAFLDIDASGLIRITRHGTLLPGDAGRLAATVGLRILMHLMGRPVLHGSVVEMSGAVFAVLGNSGAGKSTSTAALLAAGARLITEELIVLAGTSSAEAATVAPGLPHISIDPGLVSALPLGGTHTACWEREGPDNEKVLWTPVAPAPQLPARLDAVCILGERLPTNAQPQATPMSRVQATTALAAHGYWLSKIPAEYHRPTLQAALALAVTIPVFDLQIPGSIDSLLRTAHLLPAMLAPATAGSS